MKIQIHKNETVTKELELLYPSQTRTLNSLARYLLFSGGFGCGKTLIMLFKLLIQHLSQANNYVLIGRYTYPELKDTVMKIFFEDVLPSEYIADWNKSEKRLLLTNGTEVIFRHLKDISQNEIRSMNLGAVLIDQAEEISEDLFLAFRGRLRRTNVNQHQMLMTCNPVLFWGYKYFKQKNVDRTKYELIEGSTLDNAKNLPESYIADLLTSPEAWKRQFVYGIWDESLLSDRAVIAIEYIQQQKAFEKDPAHLTEGVEFYIDKVDKIHSYQIGIDTSEGLGQDESSFSAIDCFTGEQVAFWSGDLAPEPLAHKAIAVARILNNAFIVPEVNGIGLALLVILKQNYDDTLIYHRKIFDKSTEKETETLGWKTTFSSKPLLVDNFLRLCREGAIKIRSKKVNSQMSTFVYSNEARKHGMGAEKGFHDDGLIATLLSCLNMHVHITHPVKLPSDKTEHMVAGGSGGW